MIEKYINLLEAKDHALLGILEKMNQSNNYAEKRRQINKLLTEDAEARIFEIISYAVLKSHYRNIHVYFGFSPETVKAEELRLFRTGRTNANDGGIDFVMRPVGRFFQVTEVNNYDKYLLDIEKVMHFPVTFVVKTDLTKEQVSEKLESYIQAHSGGMRVVERRYKNAIEEIITIHELRTWLDGLDDVEMVLLHQVVHLGDGTGGAVFNGQHAEGAHALFHRVEHVVKGVHVQNIGVFKHPLCDLLRIGSLRALARHHHPVGHFRKGVFRRLLQLGGQGGLRPQLLRLVRPAHVENGLVEHFGVLLQVFSRLQGHPVHD